MPNNNFEREVLDRLIVLETLIKNQDFSGVRKKANDAECRSIQNEKRIEKIESTNTWLWRTVIGAILLGSMAILFGI